MASYFVLSFELLQPPFHGCRDAGEPEWPPSPLRAFQALVAAAAARRRAGSLGEGARPALACLERQPTPTIVAPAGLASRGFLLSVPNNAMDVVARAWRRGNYSNEGDASPSKHRTMKAVRPTHMTDGQTVHYLWSVDGPASEELRTHVEALSDTARSVVGLGWGIDVAVARATVLSDAEVDALPGERWSPVRDSPGGGLRVPMRGTLDALEHRHGRFLARIGPDGFTPPPPLTAYEIIRYRRATDPLPRPVAAFSLLRLDMSGFRAFDAARRGLTVAGMLRHAARLTAEAAGWPSAKVSAFVLGHGSEASKAQHVPVGATRFAYLPLPSVEARGPGRPLVVGSIRRALVTVFADGAQSEIAWARRALSGQELVEEGLDRTVALLSVIPATDAVIRRYTRTAAEWATVTPVVLPGYDDPAHYRRRLRGGASGHRTLSSREQRELLDRLDARIEGLLRKAISQAGFSSLLAQHALLDWRKAGFWPGTDLSDRYGIPDHLRRFPRYHVRVRWRDAAGRPLDVPGPICLGGGRFHGLGLFAAIPRGATNDVEGGSCPKASPESGTRYATSKRWGLRGVSGPTRQLPEAGRRHASCAPRRRSAKKGGALGAATKPAWVPTTPSSSAAPPPSPREVPS